MRGGGGGGDQMCFGRLNFLGEVPVLVASEFKEAGLLLFLLETSCLIYPPELLFPIKCKLRQRLVSSVEPGESAGG